MDNIVDFMSMKQKVIKRKQATRHRVPYITRPVRQPDGSLHPNYLKMSIDELAEVLMSGALTLEEGYAILDLLDDRIDEQDDEDE